MVRLSSLRRQLTQMVSEIAPLMIKSHLEEYDYAGAAAVPP